MFNSFIVKNFKSINSLKLDSLTRINLFFGKNNCGKTTLLEAIFLMTGISNPELFRRCNNFRSYMHISDLSYFFHDLDVENDIELNSSGDSSLYDRNAKISFSKLEKKLIQASTIKDGLLSNSTETSILTITSSVGGVKLKSGFTLDFLKNGERNEIKIPKNYQEKIDCNYLPPRIAFETIPNMVQKILEDKEEKMVVEALQLFDPRIKDFAFANNDVMVDVGFKKRIPINLLGDGVRKFFTLILAVYCCKNGVLIVDEIDNGLHFSSMETLWCIIFKVAEQFNVQLFITTHNIDSLKGLKRVIDAEETYKSSVSFYKVIHRKNDVNEALYYNSENFSTVIEQENEIR